MQAEKTEVINDRRRTSLSVLALGILAPLATLAPRHARAAGFPARPVTLVVPFAAGGATDTLVRTLADGASKHLGQPVVVENRPGAAGVLGANFVARAKPDGYTLTIMPEPVFRLPHLQKTQFDPMQDFTYVIHLTGYSLGVATRADAPWKSWQDVVEDARRNPGKISYGTTGTNSTMHVTMEEVSQKLGIRLNHVPYKGESEIIAAMMAGISTSASPRAASARMSTAARRAGWCCGRLGIRAAGRRCLRCAMWGSTWCRPHRSASRGRAAWMPRRCRCCTTRSARPCMNPPCSRCSRGSTRRWPTWTAAATPHSRASVMTARASSSSGSA